MIALVEGASRQKTPNEIALTILLAVFTLVFLVVCITLKPIADYSGTEISIAALISLFVCLIPTTIGGLLSAIGIAGMNRALRANVITKSGKAVETAGDISTLLLDKTGTITIGNRKATGFFPVQGFDKQAFVEACLMSSVSDDTPEGKSIIELGHEYGVHMRNLHTEGARMIQFTAETKCSGINLSDGTEIRKGAFDTIRKMTEEAGQFAGLTTEEANKAIAQHLEDTGALFALQKIIHQYPHCWRCKKPVLFRATEQWFCSVDAIKDQAIEAIKGVKWIPGWGEDRISSIVRDRNDWGISRQRRWGVPIPIFYCKDCGEPLIEKDAMHAVSELFRAEGSDAWYIKEAEEILPAGTKCKKCGCAC